ncbi:hypothetical protein CKO28_02345 [Rhodovibrio sodomensis]|uniref:N-acetyltransferase domain-containing protein n=1 Tax=Rhodovibrio sodomensis TaxID=1088 RepID=A0ABS1D8Z1_9PROT|nr:GNAT family N-acetyltransferase [Rhodovibrio sodomensis]MBK1666882.1 hypothetical protein [Rhodovibrio sodomensis]
MSWTDERIQELTRLWQAGHSASEIGKRLGVSKNSIVGKAHRLKLPSRPSPIKQQQRAEAAGQAPAGSADQGAPAASATPAGAGRPASASAKASVAQTASAQSSSPQSPSPQSSSPQSSSTRPSNAHAIADQPGRAQTVAGPNGARRSGGGPADSTQANGASTGVTAPGRSAAKAAATGPAKTTAPSDTGARAVNAQAGPASAPASGPAVGQAAAPDTGARAASSAVDQHSAQAAARAGGAAARNGTAARTGGQRAASSAEARRSGGLGQGAGGATRLGSQRARVEQRGSSSGCLWPIGDPGDADFHFCGADPVPGKPYCEEHAARAGDVGARRSFGSTVPAVGHRRRPVILSEDAVAMPDRPTRPARAQVNVPSQHGVGGLPAGRPERRVLTGHWCRLEPLDAQAHADALAPHALDPAARDSWAYMPYGPFDTAADYRAHLDRQAAGDDPLFFAVRDGDAGHAARGVAALMSIAPEHGRIEIGHIWFAPVLQRTRAASEAVMLLAIHAFDLGYRRLEWKCNAANAGSRRAALRLGFTFEGIHRRHMAVKGRNRDTAWYSIVSEEWPAVRAAYEAWRDPANFDGRGRQKTRLAARTESDWDATPQPPPADRAGRPGAGRAT